MNMYEALKLTAAHIAKYPANYNFQVTSIPPDGGGKGCVLGRLAQICNAYSIIGHADQAALTLLGVGARYFFHAMGTIMEERKSFSSDMTNPEVVVPALYDYAERHREFLEAREYPKPAIPQVVREIFEAPATALNVQSISPWGVKFNGLFKENEFKEQFESVA
jgi:hypothetical protein